MTKYRIYPGAARITEFPAPASQAPDADHDYLLETVLQHDAQIVNELALNL